MSATATRRPYIRISQLHGAALDSAICRFRQDEALASMLLLVLLGAATGFLEPGTMGYSPRGDVAGYSTLAELGVPEIEACVRRVERAHVGFKLCGGDAVNILDRIDVHYNTAQERKRREG
ncbi:MAG: hypothetical protein WA484_16010 [Solirubrobacteraceae bacterium]